MALFKEVIIDCGTGNSITRNDTFLSTKVIDPEEQQKKVRAKLVASARKKIISLGLTEEEMDLFLSG